MQYNQYNGTQTIGATSVIVSERKSMFYSKRVVFFAVNTSALGQVISISIGDEAVAGQGIVLAPGGFYQESQDAGFQCTQDRISAISSAAGGTLAIHERVEQP